MRRILKQCKLLLALVLVFFVLSGCFSRAVHERLQTADDWVGEVFDEMGIATSTPDTGTTTKFKMPDIDLSGIGGAIVDIKDKFTGGATSAPAVDKEKLDAAIVDAKDLSREAKDAIDAWLEVNGFNRYGDSIDTYYTGGTPLFDEISGEAIDRFQYILNNRPDVLQEINEAL